MTSPKRTPVIVVLRAVLLLVGLVWMGQGLNLIPGSFMTGDPKWFVIGAVCALGGLVLAPLGVSRRRSDSGRGRG